MTGRSIGAVAAGVVAIVVASIAVDVVLHLAGVYPRIGQPMGDGLAAVATSYRIVIGVAGAWLTARLAPRDPMKHAMALGYVGTGLGLLGVLATWNRGLGPRWYPVALAVLAIPQCWAGGKIFTMRTGTPGAAAD